MRKLEEHMKTQINLVVERRPEKAAKYLSFELFKDQILTQVNLNMCSPWSISQFLRDTFSHTIPSNLWNKWKAGKLSSDYTTLEQLLMIFDFLGVEIKETAPKGFDKQLKLDKLDKVEKELQLQLKSIKQERKKLKKAKS